ncbi:MAG: TrmB family transcriptional regulator [Lachnospiraceae bacterium]
MTEEELIEKLMKFGLTRQESGIYMCLYQNGALTGYEAAKITGISRSNVYGAMNSLLEKGAACILEGAANKYVAASPEEFTANYMKYLETCRRDILKNIPKQTEVTDGYITIEGYRHIMDKIENMLDRAEMRAYLSASCDVIAKFHDKISQLAGQKKKMVIITDCDDQKDLNFAPDCEKNIIFYTSEKKAAQFRLIIDSKYVLTGTLTGEKSDTALYSAQPNFVDVFKEALHNEIKLIEITGGKKE